MYAAKFSGNLNGILPNLFCPTFQIWEPDSQVEHRVPVKLHKVAIDKQFTAWPISKTNLKKMEPI